MATENDTASERLHTAAASPLGRRFWLLEEGGGHDTALAELAGMLIGIHTLARLLANSEAFRVQQAANQDHPAEQAPLAALMSEGLFAALYFLSEQAQFIAEEALERGVGSK